MINPDEAVKHEQEEVVLPSYATPFYKFLAIWGVMAGTNGLMLLTMFLILLLIQHPSFFNLKGIVFFGMFFIAFALIFFFSLRWLLRYGRYIKLDKEFWWRKPKQTVEPPAGIER
jgi:hypothetical protein